MAILTKPTEQEIEAMVEKVTEAVLKSYPFITAAIAQYGFFVERGVKPPTAVLSGFYRAFTAFTRTHMPGYDCFIARFNGDEAAESAFEDQIAALSYVRTISRRSQEK